MTKYWLCPFLLVALCGCTSTKTVLNHLNTNYAGRDFDEFVLKYGIPGGQFEMKDGSIIYTWTSEIYTYGVPATTSINAYQSKYSGNIYGTAITSGGGTDSLYCKLLIHVSPEGKILSIRSLKDTEGVWAMSRCSEYFKEELKQKDASISQ